MRVASALLLSLVLSSFSAFAGDAIYKGIDSKGNIIYTNNPKLIKNPKRIDVPPPAMEGIETYVSPPASEASKTPVDPSISRREEIRKATERLEAAKAAAAAGEEPQDGERVGVASKEGEPKRSRLRDEYFQRQESLKKEVEAAQKSLDDLQAQPPAAP